MAAISTDNNMGRPRKNISRDLLLSLYEDKQDWTKVAEVLGVSHMTVYRRLREFGITRQYRCC